MSRIELSQLTSQPKVASRETTEPYESQVRDSVLIRNAWWFTQMRWLAVAALAGGLAFSVLFRHPLLSMGILPLGPLWGGIAATLAVINLALTILLKQRFIVRVVKPAHHLWAQIAVDLVCLTFVVHIIGSAGSPAPFLYVMHIALACIFFSLRASLAVTIVATLLYISCITIEYTTGLHGGIFLDENNVLFVPLGRDLLMWGSCLPLFLFAVWFLVSRLSKELRLHESKLLRAHEASRQAQADKIRYAVQMTHQLKAPLDGIRSYLSLLTNELGPDITDRSRALISKMEAKAKVVGELVLDVLRISHLKSEKSKQDKRMTMDIGQLLNLSIEGVQGRIRDRGLSLESNVGSAMVSCFPGQIQMLFDNLLENAVQYSRTDGAVRVSLRGSPAGGHPKVTVSDSGIGIAEDKLPHIFDEHFRTKEAVRHNSTSTGIGLAIVKRVAQNHNINVCVESEIDKGTTFTLEFPRGLARK